MKTAITIFLIIFSLCGKAQQNRSISLLHLTTFYEAPTNFQFQGTLYRGLTLRAEDFPEMVTVRDGNKNIMTVKPDGDMVIVGDTLTVLRIILNSYNIKLKNKQK